MLQLRLKLQPFDKGGNSWGTGTVLTMNDVIGATHRAGEITERPDQPASREIIGHDDASPKRDALP